MEISDLPAAPESQYLTMACLPKPCNLFIKTVTTPEPDHDNCTDPRFCECYCHGDHIVDLRNIDSGSSIQVSQEFIQRSITVNEFRELMGFNTIFDIPTGDFREED